MAKKKRKPILGRLCGSPEGTLSLEAECNVWRQQTDGQCLQPHRTVIGLPLFILVIVPSPTTHSAVSNNPGECRISSRNPTLGPLEADLAACFHNWFCNLHGSNAYLSSYIEQWTGSEYSSCGLHVSKWIAVTEGAQKRVHPALRMATYCWTTSAQSV